MRSIWVAIWLFCEATASLHPTESPIQNNTFICGATRNFTAATGFIESPGYPIRYPTNVYCAYDINVDWGFRIGLTWKDFDIDGDMPYCSGANDDYVEAFTGCGTNRRFLARFCSRNSVVPHALYSVDNCMSLHFFTRPAELAKISKGFMAEYRAINNSRVLTNQNCNRTLAENTGIIHSTFWPRTYFLKQYDTCNWHLKLDPTMVVQFTFMDLDTADYYGRCNSGFRSNDGVLFQGIGSLYRSKQSWKEFSGHCSPFLYRTLYNEMVINWRITSVPRYFSHPRGLLVGYVSYKPIDRNMAIWQYAILITAAFLAMGSAFLFSCRHVKRRQSTMRHRYRRLFNVNSVSGDLSITSNQQDVDNVEQHTGRQISQGINDVGPERSEASLQNEAQNAPSQEPSIGDLSSCANPEDLDSMRMRNFANIGHYAYPHDVVPRNNIRVEAIFHPLPVSVEQQQQPTFSNQPHGHVDGDNATDFNDHQILNQQEDIGDTLTNSVLPSSALPTPVVAFIGDNVSSSSLPPTSVSTISFAAVSIPQTSSNEPEAGYVENDLTVSSTIQPPGDRQSTDIVNNEIPEDGLSPNNTDRAPSSDFDQAPDCLPPMAPPPYEDIYNELQSLSRVVEEIISSME